MRGVGNRVDRNDFSVFNRETEDEAQPTTRCYDDANRAIHERGLGETGPPRLTNPAFGRLPPADATAWPRIVPQAIRVHSSVTFLRCIPS